METTRQLKVAKQIQKDISDIFLHEAAGLFPGTMVSVTVVRVSPDLSFAKIFLSAFPFEKGSQVIAALEANNRQIRMSLGRRLRNQLKQVPEIAFHIDDSLEYIENIDKLIN